MSGIYGDRELDSNYDEIIQEVGTVIEQRLDVKFCDNPICHGHIEKHCLSGTPQYVHL